jgi:hypothetical protein
MHEVLPPYVVDGRLVNTFAECEHLCSKTTGCKYGSTIPTAGRFKCYLSDHGLMRAQPCASDCRSFRRYENFGKDSDALFKQMLKEARGGN